MEFTPVLQESAALVRSYGAGGFVIGQTRYEGSVLLGAQVVQPLALSDIAALTPASLAALLEAEEPPELILFGCGARMQPVPAPVRHALDAAKIGFDAMDTGAACRTLNILLAEDRRAAAVLVAV